MALPQIGFIRCCLAAIGIAFMGGMSVRAAALPPMPSDGIRDDARAMTPEAHRALAEEINAFQKRTGIIVVVDTNSFLEQGNSTGERCHALLAEWVKDRPGVVFCLNRSVKPVPYIVFSSRVFERYLETDLSQAAGEVTEAMNKVTAPENRIPVGVRVLMGRLATLEKSSVRRNQLFHRREMEMIAVFVGFLLVAGLITLVAVRWRRRLDAAEAIKHYFPDVEMAQRFGAPSGGGTIVELGYVRGQK